MRVVWLTPQWPWPATSGAQLRIGGLVEGLVQRGASVTLVGPPLGDSSIHPAAGCAFVGGLRSGHDRSVRIANLLSGKARDTCVPDRHALARIDWASVDVVIGSQPFLAPVLAAIPEGVPFVLDAHNVEADLAEANFRMSSGLGKVMARLEGPRVARAELEAVRRAALVVCTSSRDAKRLGVRTVVVPSGSAPSTSGRTRASVERHVLMVGHLAFAPNVDAVDWLLNEILPIVRQSVPDMVMTIAGRTPTSQVRRRCARAAGVHLVSDPSEVTSLYAAATVAVVPLRHGSGTRLKVLEAVRLKVPVVTTGKGIEGLPFRHDHEVLVADSATEFARAVVEVVQDANLAARLSTAAAVMLDGEMTWRAVAGDLWAALQTVAVK